MDYKVRPTCSRPCRGIHTASCRTGPLVFFQQGKRGGAWSLQLARSYCGCYWPAHTYIYIRVRCWYILAQCTDRVVSQKIWIVPFPFELHCDTVFWDFTHTGWCSDRVATNRIESDFLRPRSYTERRWSAHNPARVK